MFSGFFNEFLKEIEAASAGGGAGVSFSAILTGAAIVLGPVMVKPDILPGGHVGQSNAEEMAEKDRVDAENAQTLGQARGAGEEHSQSDDARDKARTNGGLVKEDVHGNSHATEKPAEGYSLRDKDTGEVLKYGETTQGTARYAKEYLKEHNADMVFEAKGTKAQMHKWQHGKILEYKKQNNGARPPLNKSDY